MFRSLVHAIAFTAIMIAGVTASSAENRVALVIGQSAYRAVTPLPNPANDAKAMTQLLVDAGFDVTSVSDLSQNDMRQSVGDFAAKIASRGPDAVALVFYAGHGLQIDGENYLVPVDIDPKREADIPLQAVRLNDVLNTLASVPSRSRIILLDACRNNPFPEINKTAGRGLALVDAKIGAAGTLLSFSTSPGAEAEDGAGGNSPYTGALLKVGRDPSLSIEETFKRVRLSVNQATEGRQTPWESSSLVSDFRFFGQADPAARAVARTAAKRTVDDWRRELKGKPVAAANELIVADGSVEAYEAFVGLYAQPPFGPQARIWLDRHRRMVAWNNAVIINTAAGYHDFLVQFPDSDLTATARKLEDRLRNRPSFAGSAVVALAPAVAPPSPTPSTIALTGPTCPCGVPAGKSDPAQKKRAATPPPKRVVERPRRNRDVPDVDDVVEVRRQQPVYEPPPGPYIGGSGFGVGLGGGVGGYGRGGGNLGGGNFGGGNAVGRGRY